MSIFNEQCMLQNKNLVKYHSCTARSYVIKNEKRYPSSTLKLVTGMTSKSSKPKLYILHYLSKYRQWAFFSFTTTTNNNNDDDDDDNGISKKCLYHYLSSMSGRLRQGRIMACLPPPPSPFTFHACHAVHAVIDNCSSLKNA